MAWEKASGQHASHLPSLAQKRTAHIHTHKCACACGHVNMYVHTCNRACAAIYVGTRWVFACMCMQRYVCSRVYRHPKCGRVCTHTHVQTQTHTWVQIHGHTCLDVHINLRQQTHPLRESLPAPSRATPSDALPSGAWSQRWRGQRGGRCGHSYWPVVPGKTAQEGAHHGRVWGSGSAENFPTPGLSSLHSMFPRDRQLPAGHRDGRVGDPGSCLDSLFATVAQLGPDRSQRGQVR